MKNETAICLICSASFGWTRSNSFQSQPRFCDRCTAAEIRENHEAALAKGKAMLASRTPDRFQTTDTAHPDFNRKLWERIGTWNPGKDRPWLGLIGETGLCKTRCSHLLLKRLTLEMIRPARDPFARPSIPSIQTTTAYDFAEAVAQKFGTDRTESTSYLRRLRSADIVLLDDLGKHRNTPAVYTELFAVLDHRHAANLPTIWTANSTPEQFLAGMPEDMGAPLAGRIRESSTIITLS